MAEALPSRTASAARTSVESFLRRTPCAGVLVHGDDLGRDDQLEVAATFEVGGADQDDGDAERRPQRGTRRGSRRVPGHRPSHRRRSAASTDGCDQPTSMATRSLYQPQAGHTVCGSLAAAQRGTRCAPVPSSFQAPARWLRVFDFDFFFLGTAIGSSSFDETSYERLAGLADGRCGYCSGRFALSWLERRPSAGSRDAASQSQVDGVEVGPARRAQPGAVGPAQGASGSSSRMCSRTIGARSIWSPIDLEGVGVGDDVLVQLVRPRRRPSPSPGPGSAGTSRAHGARTWPSTTMPSVSDSRRSVDVDRRSGSNRRVDDAELGERSARASNRRSRSRAGAAARRR